MSGCSGNCSSCASSGSCSSQQKQSFLESTNQYSHVKKVIGVVSGKGGVGKSMVTATLAVLFNRKGYNTAILDADITGPSIPKMFGIHGRATGTELGIDPAVTANGIKVMSVNLMLPHEEDPVIWRGPVLSGVVKQFWTDVVWNEVDYMFVDMPPGTGDVPLTVFQSLPLDGIVIVTSPQDLVSLIVKKAYNMAKMMNVPVLGLVENFSYIQCPDCGKVIHLFGKGKSEEAAAQLGIPLLAQMPIDPSLAALVDEGEFEKMTSHNMDNAADALVKALPLGE